MSIDVVLRQKGLLKKRLPLNVILGKELSCGVYDDALRLDIKPENPERAGEILVYRPEQYARGISVVWTAREKCQVVLRALTPSTEKELRDFYGMVARISEFWNCRLEVDGKVMSPAEFQAGFDDMLDFNHQAVTHMARQILKDKDGQLTFFSARWPLTAGREEALCFLEKPDSFGEWLNDRQSMDVYFAAPGFFQTEKGIVGRFALTAGARSVFPTVPRVPLGFVDPETGKLLEVSRWEAALCSPEDDAPLGWMEYGEMIGKIPGGKTTRYDESAILIEALSRDELLSMLR